MSNQNESPSKLMIYVNRTVVYSLVGLVLSSFSAYVLDISLFEDKGVGILIQSILIVMACLIVDYLLDLKKNSKVGS